MNINENHKKKNTGFKIFDISPDIWFFILAIIFANSHIITGNFRKNLVFLPGPALSGEWIRFFTHPFIHITWYHLVLDAGAFFLLYTGLKEAKITIRLFYVIVCGTFSLGFAMFFSPMIKNLGLCGLSGIAHGLMAISCLEMIQSGEKAGIVSLLGLIFKGIYEFITGNLLFAFLQFGMCGSPIAPSHTGGIIGGIFVWLVIACFRRLPADSRASVIAVKNTHPVTG